MAASEKFSETKSKGFYMATGLLSEGDILAMAKVAEEKNLQEEARLKQRAATCKKG